MLKSQYPYYLANKAVAANADLPVIDKYSGEVATKVALADEKAIDKAIGAAVEATEAFRTFPGYKRQEVLNHCVKRFTERFDELARPFALRRANPSATAGRSHSPHRYLPHRCRGIGSSNR